jgi:hypothetical protein
MTKKPTTYFFKKAIKIPMYSGYFLMVFSNDEEKVQKITKCKNPLGYLYAFTFHNFTYNKYECFCMVLNFWNIESSISLGTIMHEINHVGNRIMLAREMMPNLENDEAESYLKGWIGDCVENFMIKCKIV